MSATRNIDRDLVTLCSQGSLTKDELSTAFIRASPGTRNSALRQAAENGRADTVTNILATEVDPPLSIDAGTSICAAYGGLEVYRILHAKYPNIIHVLDEVHGSALHTAIRGRDLPLMRYLLDNGVNPGKSLEERSYRFYDSTPLDDAVLVDSEPALRLLIERGATLQASEALQIAASMRRLNLVRVLIELGADVNLVVGLDFPEWDRCQSCSGPLHGAARGGFTDVVGVLLDHGADVGLRDTRGNTPLDYALEGEHILVTGMLKRATQGF